LSARETLDFYGRIFGLDAKVRKSRIESLLEMVGLTGMANRPVGTYSKGMARRIGLAQALINDPEVLILDEPTSGMDPVSTRHMKDLFSELARRGKTILLCSHLLADVEDVCDRIGILYGGRMQLQGEVKSLLQKKDAKQIVTGPISDSAMEKIRQIVEAEGTKFEITTPMDKLEEFFIRTVATAQQEKLPTSGAVDTAAIEDFLGKETATGNILDKLVSANVPKAAAKKADVDVTLEKPTAEVKQDTGMLEELSKAVVEPVKEDATEKTTSVEMGDSSDDEVKSDVLDDLTGKGGESNDA